MDISYEGTKKCYQFVFVFFFLFLLCFGFTYIFESFQPGEATKKTSVARRERIREKEMGKENEKRTGIKEADDNVWHCL